MTRILTVFFVLLSLAAPALADGELQNILTDEDKARLAQFDTNKTEALAQAQAKGDPADVKLLEAALEGSPLPTEEGFDATGTWRCRVMKLGGGLPLTIYPNFTCVISDDGAGWFLKKTTGSQRTEGRFYTDSATRLVYVGASYVQGEKRRKYREAPKENQVAYVEQLAENRLVLQFPRPAYESDFDILVLER